MNLQEILGRPLGQRLAWTLLHFLWQGLLISAGVTAAGWLLSPARTRGRYAVALAGLVLMACCPLATFGIVQVSAPKAAARAPAPDLPATEWQPRGPVQMPAGETAVPKSPTPDDKADMAPSPVLIAVPPVEPDWRARLARRAAAIQPYSIAAWLAGVVLLAARLLTSVLGVRRLARSRLPVSAELAASAARLAQRLGLRASPGVFLSRRISEAMLVGLWRPMVLLPAAWLAEMPPDVLEAVIAHELAHVRRLDLWANLLQRVVETLLFYHPAVWWLSRRASLLREMCADELAVQATGDRMTYAGVLEHLGRRRLKLPTPQFAAGIGGRRMALFERVRNVMGVVPSDERLRWWPAGFLALVVPLGLWLISLGVAKSQPARDSATETVVIGRIVDSAGNGVPAAQVAIVSRSRNAANGSLLESDQRLLGSTKSDGEGRFRLSIPKLSSAAYLDTKLVAIADGFNFGWTAIGEDVENPRVNLSLSAVQTVRGRVLDAGGKPAVGAEVYVISVGKNQSHDFEGIKFLTPPSPLPFWPRSAPTDREGRFTLRGVDRSQILFVQVRDDRFAIDWIQIGASPGKGGKDARVTIGPNGEVVISPSPARIFAGKIIYDDTRRPAAAARIEIAAGQNAIGSFVNMAGLTDAAGGFRLTPFSGKVFFISVYPHEGEPYLRYDKQINLADGQSPSKIDIALPRGVLLRGTITEKPSGRPVAGAAVEYEELSRPIYRPDRLLPDFSPPRICGITRTNGTYEIGVPPGHGALFVQGPGNDYVRQAVSTRDFNKQARAAAWQYVSAFAAVDLKPNQPSVELDLAIRPGMTLQGGIVGPDDRPAGKVLMLSRHFASLGQDTFRGLPVTARDGQFAFHGLNPATSVPFYFLDAKNELGATVDISGKSGEHGPLVVRLRPCGKAIARFMTADGKPMSKYTPTLSILASPGPSRFDTTRAKKEVAADEDFVANFDRAHYGDGPVTDDQGRCTFPALIPGATYRLLLPGKSSDLVTRDFTANPGETVQLGEIVVIEQGEPKANNPRGNTSTKPAEEASRDDAPHVPPHGKAESREAGNFTFPISVSGRATDLNGKPIRGAKIYLAETRVEGKRLAETTTDERGFYEFRNVPLPIERSTTNDGLDAGRFEVFGQAIGYGFAWRPSKWFYPVPNRHEVLGEDDPDLPARFMAGDKIELDLHFPPPATLRGRIVDDRGKPIPGTKLTILFCEPIRPDGYPTEESINRIWNEREFHSLNERQKTMPPEMTVRRTGADGRFEFGGLPPDCRFQIGVGPPGFAGRGVWAATCQPTRKGIKGHPIYAGEMDLTFVAPQSIPVIVLYGDSHKPAPKVLVEGSTSDDNGRAVVCLPPGDYKLHLLPAYGTSYLPTEFSLQISKTPPKAPTVILLRPAAVVKVRVVDSDTGKGLANVDLWRQAGENYREIHFFRSYEVATNIAHVQRPRTDSKGELQALFEPGKHRIGVALQAFPAGYERVEADGKEIDVQAGKPTSVTFHLRKRKVPRGISRPPVAISDDGASKTSAAELAEELPPTSGPSATKGGANSETAPTAARGLAADPNTDQTKAIAAKEPTAVTAEQRAKALAEVNPAIALLEQPWQTKVTDEELDKAAEKLKPAADEAVEEIMRAFNRNGQAFAYRHRAVQLLQRLGTPKARATLLDIALGHSAEDLPSMKAWASYHYLLITSHPAGAGKLLVSDDADVLGNALRRLKGDVVDEDLLKRLIELTAYKNKEPLSQSLTRFLAADVMAADPTGRFAARKVEAILAAVEEVANMPDGDPDGDKVQKLSAGTNAESYYFRYMRALAEIRGADDALRQAAGHGSPPARDIMAIARALRGDAAARGELYSILNNPQAGLRRAWAEEGLGVVGTRDDLPLLKKLADSDPMERQLATDVGPPDEKHTYFPVRNAAREAVRQIESRQKPADKASPGKEKQSAERDAADRPRPPGYLPLLTSKYDKLDRLEIRRHYGIDGDQEKKLRDLAAKYEPFLADNNRAFDDAQKLPPQKRKVVRDELFAKQNQAGKAVRKSIEEVLTAKQRAEFHVDELCGLAIALCTNLNDEGKYYGLDISPRQRQQLKELADDFSRATKQREHQENEQMLAALSPEVRERLFAKYPDTKIAGPDVRFLSPKLASMLHKPVRLPLEFNFRSRGGAIVEVYGALWSEAVRKQMDLSAEQTAKLNAIWAKSEAAAQRIFDSYEPNETPQKLLADKVQAKQAEYRQKLDGLGKDIIRQIDGTLTSAQRQMLVDQLKRARASIALMTAVRDSNDAVFADMRATTEQRAKIRELCGETGIRHLILNRAIGEKALALLTPEQRKRLEEYLERNSW